MPSGAVTIAVLIMNTWPLLKFPRLDQKSCSLMVPPPISDITFSAFAASSGSFDLASSEKAATRPLTSEFLISCETSSRQAAEASLSHIVERGPCPEFIRHPERAIRIEIIANKGRINLLLPCIVHHLSLLIEAPVFLFGILCIECFPQLLIC